MKTTTGSLIKRGSNYYCFWRFKGKAFCRALRGEDGQRITHKADAERAKAKLMEIVGKQNQVEMLRSIQHAIDDSNADIARREDEQHPPLTLKQAWPAFLKSTERHDCGKATLRDYENKWTAFAEWMERERPTITTLRDAGKETATSYMESLNRGKIAPATFNYHLATLRYIFRVLKDDAKLLVNVWEGIKRRTVIANTRRELTVDELKKVCRSATGEMRVLIGIGLYTGLRLGDCCTLRWCEVDLQRNQIRRIPNKNARRKPKVVVIPIHSVLRNLLAQITASKRGEHVLPRTADIYINGSRPIITRAIQRHFRKCGIKTTKPNGEGRRSIIEVGFHSLRHTFISMCREANAPLSVVENIVGHSSVDMTRHYTHTSELAAANAVALLPSVTGSMNQPPPRTRDDLLREAIESITAKNWRAKKAAALQLLAGK